jgi:hypothetical protein
LRQTTGEGKSAIASSAGDGQRKIIRNMCPSCLKALAKEFESLRDVADNEEMRALIKQLRKALKDDKTGM